MVVLASPSANLGRAKVVAAMMMMVPICLICRGCVWNWKIVRVNWGTMQLPTVFCLSLDSLLTGSAVISAASSGDVGSNSTSGSQATPRHHDALGASIRIPGILHYLEYVVCDVLSASDSRFYIDGPQGEGQRWRLMSRAFDVLSAVLLNYPVHLYPALQRKVALVEASQKETGLSSSRGDKDDSVGLRGTEEQIYATLARDFRHSASDGKSNTADGA